MLDSFQRPRFTESLAIRVLQRRAYDLRDEEYLRLNILACMLRESDVTNKSSRQQNLPVSAISRARETPYFRPRTACKCTTSCGDHSVQLSRMPLQSMVQSEKLIVSHWGCADRPR